MRRRNSPWPARPMSNQNRGKRNRPKDQPATRQADVVSSRREKVEISTSASYEGPLPPPAMLERYEEVIPGSANRILEMAEKQTEHRINIEKTAVGGDSKRSYFGLAAGFVLSAMVILGGVYLIANDHDWAGVSLIGVNLVGLAGVFVYGSNARRAERSRKAERMPQARK